MIPAFAMSYIHNGDRDTLTDEEITLIDRYLAINSILTVGIPDHDPFFSPPPFGFSEFKAGYYYDVECLVEY